MANPISWYLTTFYQYQELRCLKRPGGPASFRLLHLLPGEGEDQLSGTLREYELGFDSAPEYECLSYRWQGKDESKYVLVDGKRVEIYQSLWDFLRVLRHPSEEVTLWADAICIDQENTSERSNQVGLMGRIYSGAGRVNVWLGEARDGSDALFNWAANGIIRSDTATLPADVLRALECLSRRSYWSRAWIVQECIMASKIVVHCGTRSLGWDTLAKCVSLAVPELSKDSQRIAGSWGIQKDLDSRSPFYFWQMLITAQRDVRFWKTYDYVSLDTQRSMVGMDFLALLCRFSETQCSRRLDKIYAFVPLADMICRAYTMQGPYFSTPSGSLLCNCHRAEDHHAITPDYRPSFATVAVRLAIVQGKDNALVAWNTIRKLFAKELEGTLPPIEPISESNLVRYEQRTLFQHLKDDLQIVRGVHDSALQRFLTVDNNFHDRLVDAYVVWLRYVYRLLTPRLRDQVAIRCFELVGPDFADRIGQWVHFERFASKACAHLPPVPISSAWDSDDILRRYWRWPFEQRFDLPSDSDLAGANRDVWSAVHSQFLEALWGALPWPEDAWTLALSRGWKVQDLYENRMLLPS